MRRNRDARDRREREAAQAIADQFDGRTIPIEARAGEGGRLFGSVTVVRHRRGGAGAARRRGRPPRLALDEPLKELGVVELAVRLHPDVVATLHVEVEAAADSS